MSASYDSGLITDEDGLINAVVDEDAQETEVVVVVVVVVVTLCCAANLVEGVGVGRGCVGP